MKKLEIVIRSEKLEELKKILEGCEANGVMISNIMGYGNQKGYTQTYRGTKYVVNLLPKVKVETVVPEDVAENIIDQVVDIVVSKVPVRNVIETAKAVLYTGHIGDGKIFVYDVQDVVRIRTGEHGENAL